MHFELQASVTYNPLCGEFASQTQTQFPSGVMPIMSFSLNGMLLSLIKTGKFLKSPFKFEGIIKLLAPKVKNGILSHFTMRFLLKILLCSVKLPYIVSFRFSILPLIFFKF